VKEVKPGVTEMTIEEDEFNPASFVTGGYSAIPVNRTGMTSLVAAGVNVATKYHGINGPGRTDLAHPMVTDSVSWMQDQGKARFGKIPFQVTAAYTEGVGHSAGSQHYKGLAVDLQPINGVTFDQIIRLCTDAKFSYIKDERKNNHIHCDMR
jgi:hypothetical protein